MEKFKKLELSPVKSKNKKAMLLKKRRMLVGSTSPCDLIIKDSEVDPVHAVLEISGNTVKIYDMNSSSGVFVNDKKVLVAEVSYSDVIKIGSGTFKIKDLNMEDIDLPPILKQSSLPKSFIDEEVVSEEFDDTPVVYPLGKSPEAEFSEYIFEDENNLFPIFQYYKSKISVEVIILFGNKILSIDYLPYNKGEYFLSGKSSTKNSIEFSYLGLKDKVPFFKSKMKKLS